MYRLTSLQPSLQLIVIVSFFPEELLMSRICGIELKSSEAILTVIDCKDGKEAFVDLDTKKISIEDDELTASIKSFYDDFKNFVRDNHIDTVVIKKRPKNGKMAGGAISFKLEALIQLNEITKIIFVSGQGIAAAAKRQPFDIPDGLKKYQENSFMAASLYLRQK